MLITRLPCKSFPSSRVLQIRARLDRDKDAPVKPLRQERREDDEQPLHCCFARARQRPIVAADESLFAFASTHRRHPATVGCKVNGVAETLTPVVRSDVEANHGPHGRTVAELLNHRGIDQLMVGAGQDSPIAVSPTVMHRDISSLRLKRQGKRSGSYWTRPWDHPGEQSK